VLGLNVVGKLFNAECLNVVRRTLLMCESWSRKVCNCSRGVGVDQY
jgi:hypothetical protein